MKIKEHGITKSGNTGWIVIDGTDEDCEIVFDIIAKTLGFDMKDATTDYRGEQVKQ